MELISLIINLLLGGGMVGMLLFYSSKRRKEAAVASSAEIGSKSDEFTLHRQSIEFLSAQLQEAWSEVEKLQNIINSKRDEILSLMRQTKELEIDLIEEISSRRRSELSACSRTECTQRIR
ncbi:MAG: hypothetical protein RR921_07200 [Mucinivorans sp.]